MATQTAAPSFVHCTDPPQDWPTVSVCLKRISATQLHVGIGYRTEDDRRLLHLAWHLDLRDSRLCEDPNYVGIRINLPVIRQEEVSMACERIFATNGERIPYSFSVPNGCFDAETGKALFGPTKVGLTCATFVLAVFESVGVKLLRYNDWPVKRADDDEWRALVIDALMKEEANADHVDAVVKEAPGIRYRPEDVGAAAANYPPAAMLNQTRSAVAVILAKL